MESKEMNQPPYSDEYLAQAARVGGGARNAKALNKWATLHPTDAFTAACHSYEDVLSKIAAGAYKHNGAALGALRFSSQRLASAWNEMTYAHIIDLLTKGLFLGQSTLFASNITTAYLKW